MKAYIFKVVIEEDEFPDGSKGFYAYCPALKGCQTCGHTYQEARKNINEAVHCYVEDLIKAGDPIPVDSKVNNFF